VFDPPDIKIDSIGFWRMGLPFDGDGIAKSNPNESGFQIEVRTTE